jgi:hypothetical protein
MVRRKIAKISNEILSIFGQFKNTDHPLSIKYAMNKDKVIDDVILKYKLRDRQIKTLHINLAKKRAKSGI